MFITATRVSNESIKGIYLVLCQRKGWENRNDHPRAIARSVKLTQCGHFMMGTFTVGSESFSVSGSYGSDGLFCEVSDSVYDQAIDLPMDLYEQWKTGGGWNSAGSEGFNIRQWAIDNVLTNSQRASMKRRYDYRA